MKSSSKRASGSKGSGSKGSGSSSARISSSRQQEQSGRSGSSRSSGQPEQSKSKDQRPSGRQQTAASGAGGQYGEGNYAATRQYNEGLKKHLENSDVEQEARDAAPKSASEEKEMLQAERKGKSRARGEESPGAGPEGEDDRR